MTCNKNTRIAKNNDSMKKNQYVYSFVVQFFRIFDFIN